MVGNLNIEWETVDEALRFVRHIQHLVKDPYRDFKRLNDNILLKVSRYQIQRSRVSLVELLRDTRHFGATDPRDKVFAVLGLSVEGADPKARRLWSSYDATTLEIYRDVTIHVIRNAESLEILSHAVCSQGGEVDWFPSWVPRWDRHELGQSWSIFSKKYCASANLKARYYPTADCEDLLTVGGLSFDTVKRVSEVLWTPILNISPAAVVRKIDNPIWKIWADMVRPLKIYPTGDGVEQAFVTTFLAGLSAHGTVLKGAPGYPLSHLKHWVRFIKHVHNHHCAMSLLWSGMGLDENHATVEGGKNDLQHDPSHSFSSAVGWDSDSTIQNPEARSSTMEKGYIGVGVRQVEVGDKVCVLFGNKVPIVLRTFDHQYKLVGECIAHGIMNGEVINKSWRVSGGENCERFVIC